MPAEEEAWTRRSGFEFIIPTRGALPAKLLPYYTYQYKFAQVLELTDNYARFFVGTAPVFTNVIPTVVNSSLAAGLLSLTLTSTASINVGDDLMLWAPASLDPAAIGPWRGRILRVQTVSSPTIVVYDEEQFTFVGLTSAADVLATCKVYQLQHATTPWSTQAVLQALRIVPTQGTAVILSATVYPQLFNPLSGTPFINFPILDGPYLDPQTTATGLEASAISARTGSVTFTPAVTAFDSTDVGRLIRVFTEPPTWASGTTYAYGDVVTYNDTEYWTSIIAGNIGVIPGTSKTSGSVQTTVWAPAAVGGYWSWGTITAQAGASCTVSLFTNIPATNSITAVSAFRLGVYKIGQFPTCGIFTDGRLILGGAIPNRWDASMAGAPLMISTSDPLFFSPTDPDGLVQDANGISYVMASKDPQPIQWMSADDKGVLMGTLTAEWLVASSTLNEALTPTSAKATEVTKYGSAFVEPVRAGSTLIFVQRYGQRVMEHLSVSAFSSRYGAHHLNENAKHITAAGVLEIVYQHEKIPTVWCRMTDGSLAGCTYRRVSPYMTEPPAANGWHRQVLGGDYAADLQRLVVSMTVQPNEDNLSDLLYVCTTDVNGAHAWMEVLRPIFEDA